MRGEADFHSVADAGEQENFLDIGRTQENAASARIFRHIGPDLKWQLGKLDGFSRNRTALGVPFGILGVPFGILAVPLGVLGIPFSIGFGFRFDFRLCLGFSAWFGFRLAAAGVDLTDF